MVNQDRLLLDDQRRRAAQFFISHFSREERFLEIFSRDMEKYIDAFTADDFKSDEKREGLRWDFCSDFMNLRQKMAEFRWSKNQLNAYGIDFGKLRKLFYSLFTAEEIKESQRLFDLLAQE